MRSGRAHQCRNRSARLGTHELVGLLAPSGTSPAALAKLQGEVAHILTLPELRNRSNKVGVEVIASPPAQIAAFLKDQMAKAARIVKASEMSAQQDRALLLTRPTGAAPPRR